jgi:hypothetical protein
MSSFLGWLERFENPAANFILATKMHTVLRKILKLPAIPKDDELEFRDCVTELAAKWNSIPDVVSLPYYRPCPQHQTRKCHQRPQQHRTGLTSEAVATSDPASLPDPPVPSDSAVQRSFIDLKADDSETDLVSSPSTRPF